MAANFRGYLDTLKKNDELTVISNATDLRDWRPWCRNPTRRCCLPMCAVIPCR